MCTQCPLSVFQVGSTGRVVGVDYIPEVSCPSAMPPPPNTLEGVRVGRNPNPPPLASPITHTTHHPPSLRACLPSPNVQLVDLSIRNTAKHHAALMEAGGPLTFQGWRPLLMLLLPVPVQSVGVRLPTPEPHPRRGQRMCGLHAHVPFGAQADHRRAPDSHPPTPCAPSPSHPRYCDTLL
jgi:hypothetical protein